MSVRLDMGPLRRLMAELRGAATRASFSGPFGRMFKRWGVRYLAEQKRSFIKNSRGGGDWEQLKPATIRQRQRPRRGYGRGRKKRSPLKRRVAILRDTGTLLKALTIGAAGNLFKRIRGGVRVGFGGPKGHPKGKGLTIAELADAHDKGKGNLPARYLLYPPSVRLQHSMIQDMKRATKEILRKI